MGPARFRVGPWHDDPATAYLVPLSAATIMGPEVIDRTCALLHRRGYREVVTAAVAPMERDALGGEGFRVHEELHLLRHDLRPPLPDPLPGRNGHRLRRGRRRDHDALLRLDREAFGAFWRLDRSGLHEALHATPTTRLRVTDDGARSGYAITGRAGDHGYLQRLAVSPATQRRGLGTALLADSLHWLRRRHATSVLVNTQISNVGALELYEGAGFELQPDRLAVMRRDLV